MEILRKYKADLFALLLFAYLFSSFSLPQAAHADEWARTFGKRSDSVGYIPQAVLQTIDNDYVVTGLFLDYPDNIDDLNVINVAKYSDVWIAKFSSSGGILWQKTFGGSDEDRLRGVVETHDSGYVVAVSSKSLSTENTEVVWLLKFDSNGNVIWEKRYDAVDHLRARDIKLAPDGGLILAVESFYLHRPLSLLKLNATGDIEWQKNYETPVYRTTPSVMQPTTDGGYVIASIQSSILKLDNTGSVQWHKIHFTEDFARYRFQSIQQTQDGGYVAAGTLDNYIENNYFVIKLDSGGNIQWQKSYGLASTDSYHREELVSTIHQADNGEYVISGITGIYNVSDSGGILLLGLNQQGDVVWEKMYGLFAGMGSGAFLQPTSDDGYIIAGATSYAETSLRNPVYDASLLKLNGNGEIKNCPLITIPDVVVNDLNVSVEDVPTSLREVSITSQDIVSTIINSTANTHVVCAGDDDCEDYVTAIKKVALSANLQVGNFYELANPIPYERPFSTSIKESVFKYMLCVKPELLLEFEESFCFNEPVSTERVTRCPPLDCTIDGPGCMDPYQFTRVNVSDSILPRVSLWLNGKIPDAEFSNEVKNLVSSGQVTIEKSRPEKIRYLPRMTIAVGFLVGVSLIIIGFTANQLFSKFRK